MFLCSGSMGSTVTDPWCLQIRGGIGITILHSWVRNNSSTWYVIPLGWDSPIKKDDADFQREVFHVWW